MQVSGVVYNNDNSRLVEDNVVRAYNSIVVEEVEHMVGSDDEDSVEVLLDTACNGHLVPVELMCDVKEVKEMAVTGISDSALKITHTGRVIELSGTGWAPAGKKYLVSVPQLDKAGWTGTFGSNKLQLYDKGGKLRMIGRMNKDGMYSCRMRKLGSGKYLSKVTMKFDMATELKCLEGKIVEVKSEDRVIGSLKGTTVNEQPVKRFINTMMRKRAIEARGIHVKCGHACNKVLGDALDSGCYSNTDLTSRDLLNAEEIFGPCEVCTESKMTNPKEPLSEREHDTRVGSTIYCDLIELAETSLGGNKWALAAVEGTSLFMMVEMMKTKSEEDVYKAIGKVVGSMNANGHKVFSMVFDNEATFKATFPAIRKSGILPSTTPSGMHNKVIEIKIKELKCKLRCMKAELRYVLPGRLVGELLISCSMLINSVPNVRTGPHRTPFQIVTGQKPIVPPFKFGEIGLCESMRQDDKLHKSEYGIYLYNMHNLEKSYKVFVPSRNTVYSKRVFEPTKGFPAHWDLKQRIRNLIHFDDDDSFGKPVSNDVYDYVGSRQADLLEADKEAIGNRNVPINSLYDDIEYAEMLQRDVSEVYDSIHEGDTRIEMVDDHIMLSQLIPEVSSRNNEINNTDGRGIISFSDAIGMRHDDVDYTTYKGTRSNIGTPVVESIYTSNRTSDKRRLAYRAYVTKKLGDEQERKAFKARVKLASSIGEVEKILLAYRTSLHKAVNDPDVARRESAEKAVAEEIDNLFNMGWGDAVTRSQLSSDERDSIIHAFIFLKEKTLGNGDFDKWKARLVAGGNEIVDTVEQDTYSPTANYISVMTTISLAASERTNARTYDVKGAYLIPDIKDGERAIIIRLDRELTARIVERRPELAKFVDINGTMLIRLKKYLYGLPMAGKHWNDHISTALIGMGFKRCPVDRCVFQRGVGAHRLRIVLWVDDLLVTGKDPALDVFEKELSVIYTITGHRGDNISYLALDIVKQVCGGYRVSSPGTREDVVVKYGKYIKKDRKVSTPMNHEDMKIRAPGDVIQLCTKVEKKLFASLAMSLMFLARMTRADILYSCTIVASKISNPSIEDLNDLFRILYYVASNPDYGILYKGGVDVNVKVYTDASHGTHRDGKGHGGIVITMGSGYVFAKSGKLKSVTLSSTESEGYMLCEGATYVVWVRELLSFYGYRMDKPTKMYQDNLSTIWLATHEGSFAKNKHTIVKRAYVKERIDEKELVMMHCDTERMSADMETKPLAKKLLQKHMESIGLVSIGTRLI